MKAAVKRERFSPPPSATVGRFVELASSEAFDEVLRSLELLAKSTDAGGALGTGHFDVCDRCERAADMDDYCELGRDIAELWHSSRALLKKLRKPAKRAP